jgi:hypothetical protein
MTNQQRQYRPSLDWTPDTKLPQRFARWKEEMEDEILLFEGDEKSPKYICNFIKVCSGERGKAILQEIKLDQETKEYRNIISALEKQVKPMNEEISASYKYFYLRQGDLTLTEFYKQAKDLVCAMNMDKDPVDKTLRNVLLNGLSSKEIYKECLKVDVGKLTSKAVMDIASNIQARNLMAEDLSMTAQQVLPENALTKGFPPLSSTPINRIRLQNHHPGASIQQKGCGWCGKQVRCSRNKCPANLSTCNNCGKIGHWGKVCRASSRKHPSFSKTKVHEIEDKHHETTHDDDDDAGDQESVSFHTLSTSSDPKAPHLRPMWFSTPDSSTVHLVEAEIDSGAGCNTIPLYLYNKTIGTGVRMEPATVKIKAYGDHSVKTIGSTLLRLRIGNQTLSRRFQVCDVRKHPIIGRHLSEEMGYIRFPPVKRPNLSSLPAVEKIYALRTGSSVEYVSIKKPTIQKQSTNSVTIEGRNHQLPITREYVLKEFKDVFSGMGELPGGEYIVKLKPDAEPVQHAPRRVPEKKKLAYKAEIERLVREESSCQ